jgi:hypothetical protein
MSEMSAAIKPDVDYARTITAAEVLKWFEGGHKPRPSIDRCVEIAARLTKMRWGSDPPLPELGANTWWHKVTPAPEWAPPSKDNPNPGWVAEPFEANPWWDPEKAAAAARLLLDDVPAMLWHWQRLRETPYETIPGQQPMCLREGHRAIEQLRDALHVAMPYVEFPFGQHQRQDHRKRKRPKAWHTPAVPITRMIVAALKQAGHSGATDKNSAVVRMVRQALSRMGYGEIEKPTIAAYLKSWLAADPGRFF